jgi:hypothetical protein
MKRRIRIAGATLAVAAGLIGAVAAPASAAKPVVWQYTCITDTGSTFTAIVGNPQNIGNSFGHPAGCTTVGWRPAGIEPQRF